LTLRELVWMAEGRSRDRWNHTAAILALTANCHRAKKTSKTFTPDNFHPHVRRSNAPKIKVPVSILKQTFEDNRQKG
jgi:hypothetical protein